MSLANLIQPGYRYDGPYGKAKPEDILDITASRFKQEIFRDEDNRHSRQEDYVEDQILQLQLDSRQKRDLLSDSVNPREEIPKDLLDEKNIDLIPNFNEVMVNMSLPGDDDVQDQVKLYTDSLKNYQQQRDAYSSATGIDPYNSEKDLSSGMMQSGKGTTSLAIYSYEGSAAGRMTNYLDEDGNRLNSIDSNVAF